MLFEECSLKKHHSYNKSSSLGRKEVLVIVAVWAVDAWCWWSVPGEHEEVVCFPWCLDSRDVTYDIEAVPFDSKWRFLMFLNQFFYVV